MDRTEVYPIFVNCENCSVSFPLKTNNDILCPGVTSNVRQSFLEDAEHGYPLVT
jgi:hypothetical protein